MGERALLIGGSGLMGRRVAAALRDAGHQVSVISRGARALPDRVEGIVVDRGDAAALAAALDGRRFDFTVDFLAYDAADIERLLMVPYAALGRYVMISSGQVYLVTGATHRPYREEDSAAPLIPEPAPRTPDHREWTYGVGKRRAEGALRALRASHGVRVLILRLPIVVGEDDGTLRLWAYLERLLDGGPILLPDGGGQPLRFVWNADVARLIQWLLEGGRPRETVYNFAQPDVVTLRGMLERMATAAGVTPRFVDAGREELEAAGIDRSFSPWASPWVSLIDPARAVGEFGMLATQLDDYLPGVVRWHLEHRPAKSHPGYASRPREIELAARTAAGAG